MAHSISDDRVPQGAGISLEAGLTSRGISKT